MDKLDIYIKTNIMTYLKISDVYKYIQASKNEKKLEQHAKINSIILSFFKQSLYSYKKHLFTMNSQLNVTENDFNNLKRYYLQNYTPRIL